MRVSKSFARLSVVLGTVALATSPVSVARANADGPMRLIVDTDIFYDVDDVGALAVANALQDRGEAKLLAVMVNTPSRWGAPAVDAIDTYYHHGDVPIGTVKPNADEQPFTTYPTYYPQYLAQHFPNALQDGVRAPDATALYRKVLAAQPDHSVVIASIGLLTNLARLLDSPGDQFSPLSGHDLVARKVKLLAVMGGVYPAGMEYNFPADAVSAQRVVNNWPTRQVFDGFEVGVSVMTGGRLDAETPASDPVRKAYDLYPGASAGHSSYDLTDVYYAVRGLDGLYRYSGSGGQNVVYPGGPNAYLPIPGKDENYLVKTASDTAIATALDDLIVQAPRPPAPIGSSGGSPPPPKTGPGISIDRASWRGRVLKTRGHAARDLSRPLHVAFSCAGTQTARRVRVGQGRWRATLRLPGRCARRRAGKLIVSYSGDHAHTAHLARRSVPRAK